MVKAYEGKLAEFVIPVEELGFDPLVPTNVEWSIVLMIFISWEELAGRGGRVAPVGEVLLLANE